MCQAIAHYHMCGCRAPLTFLCGRRSCTHGRPTQVAVGYLPFPCTAKWTGNAKPGGEGRGPACKAPDPGTLAYQRDCGTGKQFGKTGLLVLGSDVASLDDVVPALPDDIRFDDWANDLKRRCEERRAGLCVDTDVNVGMQKNEKEYDEDKENECEGDDKDEDERGQDDKENSQPRGIIAMMKDASTQTNDTKSEQQEVGIQTEQLVKTTDQAMQSVETGPVSENCHNHDDNKYFANDSRSVRRYKHSASGSDSDGGARLDVILDIDYEYIDTEEEEEEERRRLRKRERRARREARKASTMTVEQPRSIIERTFNFRDILGSSLRF